MKPLSHFLPSSTLHDSPVARSVSAPLPSSRPRAHVSVREEANQSEASAPIKRDSDVNGDFDLDEEIALSQSRSLTPSPSLSSDGAKIKQESKPRVPLFSIDNTPHSKEDESEHFRSFSWPQDNEKEKHKINASSDVALEQVHIV